MLRRVYWQIATDVSEQHCDSTFRTKESKETISVPKQSNETYIILSLKHPVFTTIRYMFRPIRPSSVEAVIKKYKRRQM